jgi:hypothetical protein
MPRCLSYNCESDGKCGRAADEPIHPPPYSYALVGIGIIARKLIRVIRVTQAHVSDSGHYGYAMVLPSEIA